MKTKTIYILVGTAAVGTVAFLYLREKKKAEAAQANASVIQQVIAKPVAPVKTEPAPTPAPTLTKTVTPTSTYQRYQDPVAIVYPEFKFTDRKAAIAGVCL